MVLHTGTQSTQLVHNIHQKPCLQSRARWGPCPLPPSPSGHPKFVPAPFFSTFCMPAQPWGLTGNISPTPQPLPSPQHPGEGRGPPPWLSFPQSPKGPPAAATRLSPRKLSWEVFFCQDVSKIQLLRLDWVWGDGVGSTRGH